MRRTCRPHGRPAHPGVHLHDRVETTFRHPEVVIFGLQPVAARGLLEMVAMHIDAGGVIPDGMFVGLLDNDLPAAMLPVDMTEHGDLFATAAQFHGTDEFRVCQFVWPDRNGKMPWDEGYDNRLRLAQPVIGS